jgi:predicted deacylase
VLVVQEPIAAVADGVMAVPCVDVVGTPPGPHLALIAGVHGTEYTSVAANLPAF